MKTTEDAEYAEDSINPFVHSSCNLRTLRVMPLVF